MVTPPANTGMMEINRIAVTKKPCANKGIFMKVMPGARMLTMVTITLIEPKMDEIPSM